jgi:hypothetical protein
LTLFALLSNSARKEVSDGFGLIFLSQNII